MKTKKTEEKWWNSENLRTLVENSGMTQESIAEAIGIPAVSFRVYLTEKAQPPIDRLFALADLFAVPLDYISGRCTKEECDAIEESFADNFRFLRRKDYENCTLKRAEQWKKPDNYESPYPYNLLDDIFGETFDHVLSEDEANGLNYCLRTLNEKEQTVIGLRYEKEMTLRQAGKELNVTLERIRQIQAKALRKLKSPVRLNYILYGEQGNLRKKDLDDREYQLNSRERQLIEIENRLGLKRVEPDEANIEQIGYDEARKSKTGRNGLTYSDAFLDLELSVRSFNCLARSGFLTVADVIKAIRDGSIIKVRNLGHKSLEEIINRVMAVTGMSYEELMKGATNETVCNY